MRVDPLDVVEALAGQGGQAQPDRHDDLAADLEVVLEQQVVVLADGAVDDVLDRDDAGRGVARGDGLEDLAEAAERDALDVAEGREDGVLGERAGLAGIGDRAARSAGVIGRRPSRRPPRLRADGVGRVLQIALWVSATSWMTACEARLQGGLGLGRGRVGRRAASAAASRLCLGLSAARSSWAPANGPATGD